MVSVTDYDEVTEALNGGADIIDIKNPKEGALGANFPWITKRIVQDFGGKTEISATIGDIPNLPGTVTLAGLGAGQMGVNYIKFGMLGPKTESDARLISKAIARMLTEFGLSSKLVVAGYADYEEQGCLDPLPLPKIASEIGAYGILIDIREKGTKTLFDYLSMNKLTMFVEESHKFGLNVGLAGSLKKEDLPQILYLKADIIGLRRNVCSLKGGHLKVDSLKVNQVFKTLDNLLKIKNYPIFQ
jgi:uncharacterized protein (UPF0264 family)